MDAAIASDLEVALEMLRKKGPRGLGETIKFVGLHANKSVHEIVDEVANHIRACGPNDGALHSLTLAVQGWDHAEEASWAAGTESHSIERREVILKALGFAGEQGVVLNTRILRLSGSSVPIVIAERHKPWYGKRKPSIRDFYWSHYVGQLKQASSGWDSAGIARLDASTDDVVSRLSDPCQLELYPSKGLVMGYVQSGKTSHFSGLIAKAADAGYRLIIVLAGTLDILRRQTQRRIDKEIVGRELLDPEEYQNDSEWSSFVSHGGRPSLVGAFDWERITTLLDDYTSLRKHLSVLEFRSLEPEYAFNHPDNLRSAPAKLGVVKKVPARIDKLCDDLTRLKKLRSALEHVPTLIIDDESDQTSINTIDQRKPGNQGKKTSTNKSIGRLLNLLPRAQYVGYTATPFANVFIDPDDADNLFPKDFIVSLPRPDGYMGVADFYDFDHQFPSGDFNGNKNAFVRAVEGDNDNAANLPRAIDSFLIAGAIKLYRQETRPETFKYKHHTMLVHYSATQVVHDEQKAEVERIFGGGARYQTTAGLEELRRVFENDFVPVSKVRAPSIPMPKSFEELRPFLAKCLAKICADQSIRVVNGDEKHRDETPDFDQSPVWAILIGGAKLSRGYTVEGLTVSYYRRPTGAGDTLMQMGRWFGFRPGYRDLVRLFIGSKERKGRVLVDLYEAFGAVCRDEEALRAELLKYSKGQITPKQVPPLVRQHLPQLPPTSKNKMFNAEIRSRDFASEWTEKASTPVGRAGAHNLELAGELLKGSHLEVGFNCEFESLPKDRFEAIIARVSARSMVHFLSEFNWSDGKKPMSLELAYINKMVNAGKLNEWLILMPSLKSGEPITIESVTKTKFSVIERSRVSESRFGAFSDPRHRTVAKYIAGVEDVKGATAALKALKAQEYPVLVMYFVKERGAQKAEISVGFGVQYPGRQRDTAITWTVRDSARADAVVVPARGS
jgi:hypothetical protein